MSAMIWLANPMGAICLREDVCHRALIIDSFHCPDISRDYKNLLWLISCPNLILNLQLLDDQKLHIISYFVLFTSSKIRNTAKIRPKFGQSSAKNIEPLCVTNEPWSVARDKTPQRRPHNVLTTVLKTALFLPFYAF